MTKDIITRVLELLPSAFHRVGAAGDIIHAPLGLSSGMRGLLLSLDHAGPISVPRLAAMRPVSRQFVQKLVDELRASGWVDVMANPVHKRSPLICLTQKGRDILVTIRTNEKPYLDTLKEGLDADDLAITARVLGLICERLNPEILDQLASDMADAASSENIHA